MEKDKPTAEEMDAAKRKLLRELAHDAFMLGVDWVLDMFLKATEGPAAEVRKEIKALAERQWTVQ